MKRPLVLAAAFACVLSACDCGKKPETSSPGPSSPPPSTAVKMSTDGGTIERGAAKLEIPKGALAAEQDVDFVEVPPTASALSYKPAGAGFRLAAGQATFASPLIVTLPLDPSRLPAGTKPEDVYAVLAYDGMGEVLEDPPPSVDLAAGKITVLLTHAVPLASGDAGGSGAGWPVVQPAVNPGGIDTLETTPTVRWRATHGLEKAAEMVERGKSIMKLVKKNYDPLGMADPGQITITFKSMNPAWGGLCTGPNSFEVNSDSFLGDSRSKERAEYFGKSQGGTFMHEYFHCLQNKTLQHNFQVLKTPLPGDYWVRGRSAWVKEATATWMQEFMSGAGAESNVTRCKADFCYVPLNLHEADAASPHQYAAYIFFSWLDTLYSARQIVVRLFQESFSGAWVMTAGLEQDAGQGRGTFNPLDILDRILLSTPDKQGRKRSLREVYAEFLLHYCWLKDFGPLAGGAAKAALGESKDLVLLPDRTTKWTLPVEEGGKRLLKKSESVDGSGFQIVRAFHLTAAFDRKKGEKGDLEVTLKVDPRLDPRDSMLVVFPYRRGPEAPLVGNSKSPVLLKDWNDDVGAIAWVVDLSTWGQAGLEISAEVKGASATGSPPMAFTLSAAHWQDSWSGVTVPVEYRLEFAEPPGLDQMSTDDQMKFFEERGKWSGQLEKETDGWKKWFHLVVAGPGAPQHFYARSEAGNLVFKGDLYLPRAAGDATYTATVTIHGKALRSSSKLTVKLPGDVAQVKEDIQRNRKAVEERKKDKAAPADIAALLNAVGDDLEYIHDDAAALAAWNEALALAPAADKHLIHRRLANHAMLEGDLAGYKKWVEASGEPPNYVDWAKLTLRFGNDPAGARALLKKWPTYEEGNEEQYIPSPGPGESVVE